MVVINLRILDMNLKTENLLDEATRNLNQLFEEILNNQDSTEKFRIQGLCKSVVDNIFEAVKAEYHE
jgi:hypothetical protein